MLCRHLADLCVEAVTNKISNASLPQQELLLDKISALPLRTNHEILKDLDLNLDLELAGSWIDDEAYWKRRFRANWSNCTVQS